MNMNSTSKPTQCCTCGNLHVHGIVFNEPEANTGLEPALVEHVHQNGQPLFQVRKGCLTVRHPGFLRSCRVSSHHHDVRCALCGSTLSVYLGHGLAYAQFEEAIQTHKRRHSDTDFRALPTVLNELVSIDYSSEVESEGEAEDDEEQEDEVARSDFEVMFSRTSSIFVGAPYEPRIYGLSV
jgi:hypothetical protein